MVKPSIQYVQDIYDLAGSATKLAASLGLHARTVEIWPKNGVPDKYWNQLHELYGVTPFELFRLNGKIKGYKTNSIKSRK